MTTPRSETVDQISAEPMSHSSSASESGSAEAGAGSCLPQENIPRIPDNTPGSSAAMENTGELRVAQEAMEAAGKLSQPPYQVRVGGEDGEVSSSSTPHSTTSATDHVSGATGGVDLNGVVDRLLEKQRRELMFELRRLQHGERPVTGQGHREAVQHFFDRQLNQSDTEPVPAEQRPESVVVEVNALVERRPVSSVLQSAQFRQSLESALRGALGSVQSGPPRRRVATSTPQQQSTSATPPRVSRVEQLRTGNHVHNSHSSSSPARDNFRTATAEAERVPPTPSTVQNQPQPESPSHLPRQVGPSRAQAWLQREPLSVDPGEENQRTEWENIEQVQRENVIADISELVQRQLVSSALDGQFRGLLEAHVRDRVVASGTNGHQVQEFVRSLPRTLHERNDFSDLGILDPQQQAAGALSDDVSVISATAAVAVPYAQSQSAMSHELRALKAQMKELQSMLRLSLDMQLDTQRAIRQEVAAALNQQGVTSAGHPPRPPRPVSDTQCLICLENGADAVLYQCGHMCICYTCGLNLRSRGAHCPMCRAPIRDIIRVYKGSLE